MYRIFCVFVLFFIQAHYVHARFMPFTNMVLVEPFSDLPVANNYWVEYWVKRFQKEAYFRVWLERSYRYIPLMQAILHKQALPQDLAYISMIESGFSAKAVSRAKAVGYWQFLLSTAKRFGLRRSSWLDERRDFEKSTYAAGLYLKWLYKKFGTWSLAIAAYNMGEKKLAFLMKKHKSSHFWHLAQKADFPVETAHYIPKLMAAIMIAKAPALYGFNHLKVSVPYQYEIFYLPGGCNLKTLSQHIASSYQQMRSLNPALLTHVIPSFLDNFSVRIPKGLAVAVSGFVQKTQKL